VVSELGLEDILPTQLTGFSPLAATVAAERLLPGAAFSTVRLPFELFTLPPMAIVLAGQPAVTVVLPLPVATTTCASAVPAAPVGPCGPCGP
jgi:hypothetical protein